MHKKISVILPTLNEKDNILDIIDAVHQQVSQYTHKIIVIDDNSTDGTYDILSCLQLPYLFAIKREGARGLAASIRYGIEHASGGDILVVMDSDFNHQPKYIPIMLDALRYYDVAVCSRFLYGGGMDGNSFHYFCSKVFNTFVCMATKSKITDNLFGFFAIKKNILERCPYDDIFFGWGDYYIRLLFYLQKQGASIIQIPAVSGIRRYGESKRRNLSVFIKYSFEVFKLMYKSKVKSDVV